MKVLGEDIFKYLGITI